MAAFKFKYQLLEDVKEKFKKNAEKEYALILKEIERVQAEIENLKQEISGSFSDQSKTIARDLIFAENYRTNLKNSILTRENKLIELEKIKEERLKELVEFHKQHKIFVKLHEKKMEDFHLEQSKEELKSIDDIATKKFSRE